MLHIVCKVAVYSLYVIIKGVGRKISRWRANEKKTRKIAKRPKNSKTPKIAALLSLYLLYLYHV